MVSINDSLKDYQSVSTAEILEDYLSVEVGASRLPVSRNLPVEGNYAFSKYSTESLSELQIRSEIHSVSSVASDTFKAPDSSDSLCSYSVFEELNKWKDQRLIEVLHSEKAKNVLGKLFRVGKPVGSEDYDYYSNNKFNIMYFNDLLELGKYDSSKTWPRKISMGWEIIKGGTCLELQYINIENDSFTTWSGAPHRSDMEVCELVLDPGERINFVKIGTYGTASTITYVAFCTSYGKLLVGGKNTTTKTLYETQNQYVGCSGLKGFVGWGIPSISCLSPIWGFEE